MVSTDGICTAAFARNAAAGGTAAQDVLGSKSEVQGRAPAAVSAGGHPPVQPGAAGSASTETGGAPSPEARPAIKRLSFLFYGKSGMPCLRIYNARTGELLKEIPPGLLAKYEGRSSGQATAAGTPHRPLDQIV